MDLFEYHGRQALNSQRPLADRMRPRRIDDVVGQDHILADGSLIRTAILKDRIFSMILWGPPGCGKTTLARIIAGETQSHFTEFSAVLSGVKEIRTVIQEARDRQNLYQKKTILFVDEIHRFNKAQQDAFLHHVESGLITLIGATTENPSFEVISALLSRCRVVTLNPLDPDGIRILLDRALRDRENGLGNLNLDISPEAMDHLAALSDGDARSALNSLEIVVSALMSGEKKTPAGDLTVIGLKDVENALQKRALLYDKSGEEHYNLISAFHKSLRGSDPDAALYWLERMLAGGEDPFFIARRMIRFASEDIGNADPNALLLALGSMEAFKFLGHPEGDLALAQAAVYLATAPKSNSLYVSAGQVKNTVNETGALPVPFHIRNAPTRLMKDMGYGRGYQYAHDYRDAYTPQDYLPEKLKGRIFYNPSDRGYEKTIKQRLDGWRNLKKKSTI